MHTVLPRRCSDAKNIGKRRNGMRVGKQRTDNNVLHGNGRTFAGVREFSSVPIGGCVLLRFALRVFTSRHMKQLFVYAPRIIYWIKPSSRVCVGIINVFAIHVIDKSNCITLPFRVTIYFKQDLV